MVDELKQNRHSNCIDIAFHNNWINNRQLNKESIMNNRQVLDVIHSLGTKELRSINTLNLLKGDYINLKCKLPNGEMGKVLNDSKSNGVK